MCTFAGCDQDSVSRPTAVPHLWQVSPHLYKVRGHDHWGNSHMLVSDDGEVIRWRGHLLACDWMPG